MTRSRRWSAPALLAALAIVVSACAGQTPSQSASGSPPASSSATPAATSSAPFEGMTYPESGESACGTEGYQGTMGLIEAVDA